MRVCYCQLQLDLHVTRNQAKALEIMDPVITSAE